MQLILHESGASHRLFRRFGAERVFERLQELDRLYLEQGLGALKPDLDPLLRLGTESDAAGRITKYSCGVFSLSTQARLHPEWPGQIEEEISRIRSGILGAHGVPLRHLLWAGMGGSAEDKAMYDAIGLLGGGIRCFVLDSTDPAKLKCILDKMGRSGKLERALRGTLVVGMAMGMTSYEPVVNLERLAYLYDALGIDSRANFIYMTLPGSLLDDFGSRRGYVKVELQLDGRNTTAGRHSGPLTRGSLYPLALAGADLKSWIRGTFLPRTEISAAWRLAAFLQRESEAGRDKISLLLPSSWKGAALWTKQAFEESLGKSEETGVKIFIDEKPRLSHYRPADDPRQDRVFLAVQFEGSPGDRRAGLLRKAGYPGAVLSLPRRTVLSRYMQFIHHAVFGLAYLRDMNFVTQPSVELYKEITDRLYRESKARGGPRRANAWRRLTRSRRRAKWKRALTLYYDRIPTRIPRSMRDAPSVYGRILGSLVRSGAAEYGELTFFGDTRYCKPGRAVRKILDAAATRLFRTRLKIPVDVYEGPAMNHSYHEMIIGHGRCFSTIVISSKQESIPEAGYYGDYHFTQFLATKLALEKRGRPVVAVVLADLSAESLSALSDFFERARETAGPPAGIA